MDFTTPNSPWSAVGQTFREIREYQELLKNNKWKRKQKAEQKDVK